MAVEDFGSKPMIKVSIGTKMPPPPTPPTLPKAAPKNPTIDPTIIFHPNFMSCSTKRNNQLIIIHESPSIIWKVKAAH